MMNCKVCGRKQLWSSLRYYPGIYMEGLKNLSYGRQPLSRDLNPGPPKYEARQLATQPQRSVRLALVMLVQDVLSYYVYAT
jgi:hypothetical protein